MSRMLSKMNLISVVQQLPKEDIETIQGYVEMIEEHNQSLKKQLDYLRRSIERKEETIIDLQNERVPYTNEYVAKLENQQKEFVNYMMNTIENITHDETDDEEIKGYLIQRGNTFKEILSKYQEIIVGKE